jgi:hypothetical protein
MMVPGIADADFDVWITTAAQLKRFRDLYDRTSMLSRLRSEYSMPPDFPRMPDRHRLTLERQLRDDDCEFVISKCWPNAAPWTEILGELTLSDPLPSLVNGSYRVLRGISAPGMWPRLPAVQDRA